MVEFTLDTTDSTPKTVIDTFGDELTPYESGALFGGLGQSAQGARNFKVVVPDGHPTYNRSILVMRAEWQNAGTVVDIRLFTENYDYAWGGAASTSGAPTESTTNTLVFEPGGLANGTYYLVIDGSISGADVPENVTVTMQWYDTADLPDASMAFTYTSSDRAGVTQIVNEDTVWGDHAVVNTSFAPFNVVNLPEYEVTNVEVGFLSGVYAVQGGTLVIPSASYDPFSSPILADEFAWERVEGIVEGDNVNVEVDFSNGDCDIMAWWADSDNATWNYGNNLLGAQMATGAHPEIGSFVADQSGAIMVGIFDYDLQAGTYEVIVDTLVGIYEDADSNEMIYDTYDIGRNGTFVVEIAASTDTNVGFDYTYTELTFENFFSPSLNSIDTDGDPVVNITWTVSDLNAADNQTFTVHISNDAGLSWQLVAAGLEDTEYIWDSTGFVDQSYMAQVRVTDSYGLTDTIDSAAFDAGTVTITPTTTTTPPTTTTTPEPTAPTEDFILIGLIAGIGAGVVIVLM
ncbi:MAG: hypothetical protein ACXAEN_24230, partial [Candidatus Thorarchaeota archaeon]|jgi:hypothetical protein